MRLKKEKWHFQCELVFLTSTAFIKRLLTCSFLYKLSILTRYENGGSFFHSAGLQFGALGAAGRADNAFSAFQALMNSGFGETRGWAQQLYWGETDELVGFDPLNTALLSVWGFMRAVFGIAPTLANGLTIVNSPAKEMEGARWNMSYLGERVCLRVIQGTTSFCNGSNIATEKIE